MTRLPQHGLRNRLTVDRRGRVIREARAAPWTRTNDNANDNVNNIGSCSGGGFFNRRVYLADGQITAVEEGY